jgi:hypothetical protein
MVFAGFRFASFVRPIRLLKRVPSGQAQQDVAAGASPDAHAVRASSLLPAASLSVDNSALAWNLIGLSRQRHHSGILE